MAGQPVDYEALARQARGGAPAPTIDYNALAARARGVGGQSSSPALAEPEGTAAQRFGQGLWQTTLGGLGDTIEGVASLFAHGASPGYLDPTSKGAQLVHGLIQSHIDQGQKALDAWKRGEHVEALGHLGAAALPVIGPAAAHAAERMGGTEAVYDRYGNVVTPGQAPDIAGGLGETTGLLLPFAARTPIVRNAARAVAEAPAVQASKVALKTAGPALVKKLPIVKNVYDAGVETAQATGQAYRQAVADRAAAARVGQPRATPPVWQNVPDEAIPPLEPEPSWIPPELPSGRVPGSIAAQEQAPVAPKPSRAPLWSGMPEAQPRPAGPAPGAPGVELPSGRVPGSIVNQMMSAPEDAAAVPTVEEFERQFRAAQKGRLSAQDEQRISQAARVMHENAMRQAGLAPPDPTAGPAPSAPPRAPLPSYEGSVPPGMTTADLLQQEIAAKRAGTATVATSPKAQVGPTGFKEWHYHVNTADVPPELAPSFYKLSTSILEPQAGEYVPAALATRFKGALAPPQAEALSRFLREQLPGPENDYLFQPRASAAPEYGGNAVAPGDHKSLAQWLNDQGKSYTEVSDATRNKGKRDAYWANVSQQAGLPQAPNYLDQQKVLNSLRKLQAPARKAAAKPTAPLAPEPSAPARTPAEELHAAQANAANAEDAVRWADQLIPGGFTSGLLQDAIDKGTMNPQRWREIGLRTGLPVPSTEHGIQAIVDEIKGRGYRFGGATQIAGGLADEQVRRAQLGPRRAENAIRMGRLATNPYSIERGFASGGIQTLGSPSDRDREVVGMLLDFLA